MVPQSRSFGELSPESRTIVHDLASMVCTINNSSYLQVKNILGFVSFPQMAWYILLFMSTVRALADAWHLPEIASLAAARSIIPKCGTIFSTACQAIYVLEENPRFCFGSTIGCGSWRIPPFDLPASPCATQKEFPSDLCKFQKE